MGNTAYLQNKNGRERARSTNIGELIKKNKIEEKKDKVLKFYTLLASFFGMIVVVGLFIYL